MIGTGGWGCLTETGRDSSVLGDSSSVTWKEGAGEASWGYWGPALGDIWSRWG